LIRVYRECPELGWGEFSLLACDTPSVLAHQVSWEDRTLVALHNLSGEPVKPTATLTSGRGPVELVEPLGFRTALADRDGKLRVPLEAYGSLWLHPIS
jgi:hypothetical protein